MAVVGREEKTGGPAAADTSPPHRHHPPGAAAAARKGPRKRFVRVGRRRACRPRAGARVAARRQEELGRELGVAAGGLQGEEGAAVGRCAGAMAARGTPPPPPPLTSSRPAAIVASPVSPVSISSAAGSGDAMVAE